MEQDVDLPLPRSAPRVGIVGGGLAGLAAAVALAESGLAVELFEARRRLGGRATSWEAPNTHALIDNCQHVAMGCCTNFLDFCRRTHLEPWLRCDTRLHFFARDGRRNDLGATNWLPAPLHLAPAFLRLSYLSLRERLQVCHGLLKLAWSSPQAVDEQATIGDWLRAQGQSERAIRCFWEVVLVSALAESLDRASLAAARQVFVDGFLRANAAYHVYVPTVRLQQLYDQVAAHLSNHRATLHLGRGVKSVEKDARGVRVRLDDDVSRVFDFVVVAVPWRRISALLPAELAAVVAAAESIASSPITSLHLWFDGPLHDLPHAVLIDRLSQWVFAGDAECSSNRAAYCYQVVISASRELAHRRRESIRDEVLEDLHATFPTARGAQLLDWTMVSEQHAVFSVRPDVERLRPPQQTPWPQLLLAGDWTQSGWPATMEGAVRSGYLAAEAIQRQLGSDTRHVVPQLEPSWLARWLRLA